MEYYNKLQNWMDIWFIKFFFFFLLHNKKKLKRSQYRLFGLFRNYQNFFLLFIR